MELTSVLCNSAGLPHSDVGQSMKVCVVAEETVFYALVMPSFLFRTRYIRNLEWPAASLDINFRCFVFASVV